MLKHGVKLTKIAYKNKTNLRTRVLRTIVPRTRVGPGGGQDHGGDNKGGDEGVEFHLKSR